MIIAVDGPSASGKGTIAKALAKHFGYHYLDTGTLYRMVGLTVQRRNIDPTDEEACAAIAASLNPTNFQDAELRGELVGGYASKVAMLPKVRAALLHFQREFASREPGTVLDGRDIGTVICPQAQHKFFITATFEARASRRFRDSPGETLASVQADIQARDQRDATRAIDPLKPAKDAVVIDTSGLRPDEALALALAAIKSPR